MRFFAVRPVGCVRWGFSGDGPRNAPADLKLFPNFLERIAKSGGTPQFSRPCCTGPVTAKDDRDLTADIATLKAAMQQHGIDRAFMNAASPGVIAQFLPNQHYASHQA
jgi:5-methyltetrahydropteroyltriglutamate--homocysteine methyltransferase